MAYCSDCTFWDSSRHYCTHHGYTTDGSDSCGYYEAKSSGGCYITTALCNVLGFADDCDLMTILRRFRDNHMRKNEQYTDLLEEYDVVGPRISHAIENDPDKQNLCSDLLKSYFIPITTQLNKNNFDQAVASYKDMVYSLKTRYSLS